MLVEPKTVLFREGDYGDRMYILRSGHVRMLKRERQGLIPVADLGPGAMFGEMALLAQEAFGTTAITVDACELLVIDQQLLEKTYQELPDDLLQIAQRGLKLRKVLQAAIRKYMVCSALPGLLYVLASFVRSKKDVTYRVSEIADQLFALYGMPHTEFCMTLEGFLGLNLVSFEVDENEVEYLKPIKPAAIVQCYEYLLDRSSPKPREGVILPPLEIKALQCLISAAGPSPQTIGARVKISYVQYAEATQKYAPELVKNPKALANLSLAGVIQAVPNLQDNLTFGPQHSIVFSLQAISDLVELNELIPKITDGFYGLIH